MGHRPGTLQIGGDDMGFGPSISTCTGLSSKDLAGNSCQQYYNAAGCDQLTVNILQTAPKGARVLREIHARAPHPRVVVVGYPDLLPDDGSGCYAPTAPAPPNALGQEVTARAVLAELNRGPGHHH
ncbi:hypothetical protein [Streptomyces adustus]|uniref:hypothetical protein n=1 Tax=Streptomyces adustus TaxID=1609272 RepID=UPI00371C51B4